CPIRVVSPGSLLPRGRHARMSDSRSARRRSRRGTAMTHLDPVCGMTIEEEDAVGSFAYHGVTYFFCAPSCLERFSQDPASFLNPAGRSSEPAPAGTTYTCPMHPEIVSDAPGPCPICGMALEPRVISLSDAPNPELVDMTRRFWIAAVLALPVFLAT